MLTSILRIWCVVIVLCAASFTMVTSEFAPIGLMSQISSDLGQAPSIIGLTVTLYAWIGAASGLMSNWLNHWIPRKSLLITLMLILAVSNGLAAVAHEFLALLSARALGALAHGIFWAIVAATAAHIVPAQRVGVATSIVLGGITIATVMGVPLINLVGQHYSWRTAFVCLSFMCIASAGAIALVMPSIHIRSFNKGVGFIAVLKRKDLLITYVITGLTAAAHFSAYTFVEPFIEKVPGITSYLIAVLLFTFGAAGFLGNLLSAFFIDRYLKRFILLALISMALALTALGIYGPQIGIMLVVAFLMVWGTSISCLFTGLQTWVLRISGDDTVPATAVHTAVLNSAIGLGVIIGGNVLDVTGLKGTMISAGMMIVPAIILLTILIIRAKGCTATE
ncbi:MFS transporter [Marinomonas spartinae]|uniref:MFS transporter n=1 Tax=Marinomonas spartinae TaxID=1792290 RepID=UPI0018F23BB2|nr:MFS transporter [Marinomonas spartinae]MBJ7553525.1 MFS transporter [Marinomonas spartinae]